MPSFRLPASSADIVAGPIWSRCSILVNDEPVMRLIDHVLTATVRNAGRSMGEA